MTESTGHGRVRRALALAMAWLALGSFTAPACFAGPLADSSHAKIRRALFDLFLPPDRMPDSLRADADLLRSEFDAAAGRGGPLASLTSSLIENRFFSASTPAVAGLMARHGRGDFGSIPAAARESVFAALLSSPDPRARSVGAITRAAYLRGIYGSPFGWRLAGATRPAVERPDLAAYASAHAPVLAARWLTYDRPNRVLRSRETTIQDLVIGSGPAGSVIALELARSGRRVLLLEQGSWVVPGAVDTRRVPQLLESGGGRSSASGSVLFNNAQAVGGGTTVNVDLVFSPTTPLIQRRIDAWRAAGCLPSSGFSAADIRRADAWVRRRLGTRKTAPTEINQNNRALWDGARRRGATPHLYDLNTLAPGNWSRRATDKRSALEWLLLEALADSRSPLALVPDASVTRVLLDRSIEGTRARGVEFVVRAPWNSAAALPDPLRLGLVAGDTVRVEAERVIVCAGTLGSASLLLRSGVDHPLIGRGIVCHPAMPIIGEFDRVIDPFRGTAASVYVDHYAAGPDGFFLEAMSAEPAYAALMSLGAPSQSFDLASRYRHLAGFGVMLVDSVSASNRVSLAPDGAAVIHYDLSAGDRSRMRRAVAEGVRIMFLAGAKRVWVPTSEAALGGGAARASDPSPMASVMPMTRITQADSLEKHLDFVPGRTLLTSAHLQGSVKVGRDPMSGVLSPDFRVWDTRNLFVMDSSVFPTSVGANPMQSIYTFAKLFSERLIASDRAREVQVRP